VAGGYGGGDLNLEKLLVGKSYWSLAAVTVSIALVKTGVHSRGTGVLWDLSEFPNPVGGYPETTSYGLRTIAWLLRIDSRPQLLILVAVINLLAVGLIALAVMRSPLLSGNRQRKLAMMLLLSGPMIWTLSQNVGRVDILTISGSVLLASMTFGHFGAALGIGLLLGGNPEQSLVVGVSLLILSCVDSLRHLRQRAAWLLLLATFLTVGLTAWTQHLDQFSRTAALPTALFESLNNFTNWLPITLYSILGPAVLWLMVPLLGCQKRTLILVLGGLAVPLLATAVTLDLSRVGVTTSSAALTALAIWSAPQLLSWFESHDLPALSMSFAVTGLMPAVQVLYFSTVVAPWSSLNLFGLG